MMNTKKNLSLALLTTSIFCSATLHAALITYDFTASINTVSLGLSSEAAAGDTLIGSYTFDTSASYLGNPDYQYYIAITDFIFSFNGNNPDQNESGPGSRIITFYDDGFQGSPIDQYEARIRFDRYASSSIIGNYVTRDVKLTLQFPSTSFDVSNQDLLTSFLPGEHSPLAGSFEVSFITDIYGNSANELLTGTITSFANNALPSAVPLPPAIWLFSFGLLGIIAKAKKHNNSFKL